MATTNDLKNGLVLNIDGQLWTVIEFQHVKPGKGAAFVRTKMRNVITGGVTETSFNPTAKFENATVDRSLFIGDVLYTISDTTIRASSLAALEDLGSLTYSGGRHDRYGYDAISVVAP